MVFMPLAVELRVLPQVRLVLFLQTVRLVLYLPYLQEHPYQLTCQDRLQYR
jgi:hypothetical protein